MFICNLLVEVEKMVELKKVLNSADNAPLVDADSFISVLDCKSEKRSGGKLRGPTDAIPFLRFDLKVSKMCPANFLARVVDLLVSIGPDGYVKLVLDMTQLAELNRMVRCEENMLHVDSGEPLPHIKVVDVASTAGNAKSSEGKGSGRWTPIPEKFLVRVEVGAQQGELFAEMMENIGAVKPMTTKTMKG